MSPPLATLAAVFAFLALLALASTLRALRHGWPLGVLGRSLSTAGMFALAALFAGFAVSLNGYARLSAEQPVGRLEFQMLAPAHYLVRAHWDGQNMPQLFELSGEEWQLDARVLRWHPWANTLGFDAHWRLERLSGRYASTGDELARERRVYDLGKKSQLPDLWDVVRRYPQLTPMVDAVYGSGTYLPMVDGAAYEVYMSQTGLFARPANEAARRGISLWP